MIIGDTSLGEEDIQLTRHAASDRMDAKTNIDTRGTKLLSNLRDGILTVSNRKAIAGDDDNRGGRLERLNSLIDVSKSSLTLWHLSLGLATNNSRIGAVTA